MSNKQLQGISPADYNPRKITDKALAGLRESMTIFGDLSGFVYNKRTGNIICGHQRRRALEDPELYPGERAIKTKGRLNIWEIEL